SFDFIDTLSFESTNEGLLRIPLLKDTSQLLIGSDHPLSDKKQIELNDLADARWIAGCERCRGHFVDVCHSVGFSPQIVCSTDDSLSIQKLVETGLGIALMPNLVMS